MKKKTLWSRNFTIITLGTVISAIGGVAMGFALGFVVFDNTGSTLLTAVFSAVSLLPRAVLPVLVSPYLDNFRRKPVVVGLDYLLGGVTLLSAGICCIILSACRCICSSAWRRTPLERFTVWLTIASTRT